MQKYNKKIQNTPAPSRNLLEQEQFFMTNGIRKRKIFQNVDYTSEELQWIKMVRIALKKQNLFQVREDAILLKFYYSSNFQMNKCIQKLKVWHSWFNNPQIQDLTEEGKAVLREGFIYSYAKTNNGRPFIIMNLSIVDFDRYKDWSYYQALNHVINRVRKQQYIPGRIEFHHFIIDLNEQLLTLPLSSVSKLIAETTEAYNSCLQKMMIVNCTTISKWIYNRVTNFVSQETTNKVKLYTKQDLMEGQLAEFIDVNVLERKYGGKKPNIDHSKLFKEEQINDQYSQSTQYFSMEQIEQESKEQGCCGKTESCDIY